MLLQLEKHILCWLCLCVCSKAGPVGHVHPGDVTVLVVGFVVVVVNLFLDDLICGCSISSHGYPAPPHKLFSYPPFHSLFNRSSVSCLFDSFIFICFVLFSLTVYVL